MIYITIILVAVIAACCVLGYKYIDGRFNPDIYNVIDVTNVTRIVNDTLKRCHKYETTTGDDKYKYSINEQEVSSIMKDIAYSLNIQLEDYE